MKTLVGGSVLAFLLLGAGAVSWREAGIMRREAEAHRRLATLHYDVDATEENGLTPVSLLRWLPPSPADEARRRATASYWLSRFDAVTEIAPKAGSPNANDAALLLLAANASFRQTVLQPLGSSATLERLDGVVQSYAEILRQDSSATDAAFNYEFVSRMRDALAKGPAKATAKGRTPAPPQDVSADLPAGPTIHGRPGGPPEGTVMSDFKTVSPMRPDEREQQSDPGRGREFKRKG